MTDMNQEQLKRVAHRLLGLLAEEKIPIQWLSVLVDVPAAYLTAIITNFPIRMRSLGDIAVTVSDVQERWDITVALAIIPRKKGSSFPGSDTLERNASSEITDAESGPIDEPKARDIAAKIRAIFVEAGLEVAGFQVLVTVPTEFYEFNQASFRAHGPF